MIRSALVLSVLALAACSPPVPDSGAIASYEGYSDLNSYRVQRDAELEGRQPTTRVTPNPAPTTPPPTNTNVSTTTLPNTTASDTPPADGAIPTETAQIDLNNPNISDEQDFEAVSNRQTIESDAERLRRQREAYQVIQPTAVPTRSGGSGPNIVEYALSTNNAVGQKVHRRTTIFAGDRYQKNCAKYASPDLAQEAFLRSGGPERDKMGLDPDGDGFACAWDPTPFRRIASARG